MNKYYINNQEVFMSEASFNYLVGFFEGKIQSMRETAEIFEKNFNITTKDIISGATSGTEYGTDTAQIKQNYQ